MCGIFGIVSNKNIIKGTLTGISNLEYRGYDSAGIGYIDKDKISVIKEVGEIKNLITSVDQINPSSTTAIAHTRWATHGSPNKENAHPFVTSDGRFCLVHNGIIENYAELKNTTNSTYTSTTDSEVILSLIEKYYNGDMLSTINYVCRLLKGSYALAILSAYEPNKIYVCKNISPCVVGVGENGSRVCSDINGIGKVEYAYILGDKNIATLCPDSIHIYDDELNEIHLNQVKIDYSSSNSLGEYHHFMRKEIYEIPATIKNTYLNYSTFNSLKNSLPDLNQFNNIIIIGCGTAYHSGLIGTKILELNSNLHIRCEIASEFIYSNTYIDSKTLAIFVSQSGETADTLKALQIAKNRGATTLAITNVKNSSITFHADYCLYTYSGSEVAVASTKAYIGQLTIFYLLGAIFSNNEKTYEKIIRDLTSLSVNINIPTLENTAIDISNDIYNQHDVYMVGRDLDFVTATESSLKLKEISYIHSEAYPSGELKHGTISLIEDGTFVFVFMTEKDLIEKSINNALEVISRGGKVITISQYDISIPEVYKSIKLSKFDDYYMPLYSIVLMQLVAYHTSIRKGLNPDKPRSLAKSVTVE